MHVVPGIILLVAALAGCADPYAAGDGDVSVALVDGAVVLRNGLDEAIHYAAIGDNALILFAPCVGPGCPRLEAGARIDLPVEEIPAGIESDTISLHWWLAHSTAGGDRVPGVVRTIRLAS